MVFRWRADDGPTLNAGFCSFVIFQGIRASIAKKPYVFVIFRGGGGGVRTPCPPSGSARDPVRTYVIVSKREKRSWQTVSPEIGQSWSYRSKAQRIVSERIYPHHYVSKPKIAKKSHDQIRMDNHGNRNVSHDSGNAALASDNVQMKRWKYFIKIPAKYMLSFLKAIRGLCALVHILQTNWCFNMCIQYCTKLSYNSAILVVFMELDMIIIIISVRA